MQGVPLDSGRVAGVKPEPPAPAQCGPSRDAGRAPLPQENKDMRSWGGERGAAAPEPAAGSGRDHRSLDQDQGRVCSDAGARPMGVEGGGSYDRERGPRGSDRGGDYERERGPRGGDYGRGGGPRGRDRDGDYERGGGPRGGDRDGDYERGGGAQGREQGWEL